LSLTPSSHFFPTICWRDGFAAGLSFLKANEYTMDITNEDLVKVLDEASVGKASLSKLNSVIRRLIRND
jgi:prophage maintenance system killer protein